MGGIKHFFSFHLGDLGLILLVVLFISLGIGLFSRSNAKTGLPQPTALDSTIQADTTDRRQATTNSHSQSASPRTINDSKNYIHGDNRETNAHYVGPPAQQQYTPKRRLPHGATLCLNSADSAALTLVPGIGPSFARRIVALRKRLGGFYTVLQLQEVYGMTPDRYQAIKPFFRVEQLPKKLRLATMPYDSLPRHPYLSYEQRNALERILFRDGQLHGWSQLKTLDCFGVEDSIRLSHYFIFE